MDTPIPHKVPMSSLLPHPSNPWPSGYSPLPETLTPVDDVPPCGMSPRMPGQTSNPIVVNQRSTSSPPIPSATGGNPQLKWC